MERGQHNSNSCIQSNKIPSTDPIRFNSIHKYCQSALDDYPRGGGYKNQINFINATMSPRVVLQDLCKLAYI